MLAIFIVPVLYVVVEGYVERRRGHVVRQVVVPEVAD
jgi:hypothetical protein